MSTYTAAISAALVAAVGVCGVCALERNDLQEEVNYKAIRF
jgi:hypothetical protein